MRHAISSSSSVCVGTCLTSAVVEEYSLFCRCFRLFVPGVIVGLFKPHDERLEYGEAKEIS